MWFYTVWHGNFHDRGYSDILYGINSIDIMGSMLHSRIHMVHNHLVITLFFYPDWVHHHRDKPKYMQSSYEMNKPCVLARQVELTSKPECYQQGRSQIFNLGWAREDHFLILLLFSSIFPVFFLIFFLNLMLRVGDWPCLRCWLSTNRNNSPFEKTSEKHLSSNLGKQVFALIGLLEHATYRWGYSQSLHWTML